MPTLQQLRVSPTRIFPSGFRRTGEKVLDFDPQLIVFILLLIAVPAHAEKRVALVIGNATYKNAATLQNPKNDAVDVSEVLKRLGFETIVGLDLDKANMEDATIKFARAARDADVALVYYSGHAMQFGGSTTSCLSQEHRNDGGD
jgi:hypothetical protein